VIEDLLKNENQIVGRDQFREAICKLEEKFKGMTSAVVGRESEIRHPLFNTFAEGCYIREVHSPAGEFIISKIHKYSHPWFLLQGELSILGESGVVRITAPCHGITSAGSKRVLYSHSEIVFVTVHVTKETDLDKIEEEIIAKDFKEIDAIIAGGDKEK
jgi:hypothetical protein